MSSRSRLGGTILGAAFVLGACSDAPTSPSVTRPSAVIVGPSSAECTGPLVGGTYQRVVVPAGASCTMTEVTVVLDVTALEGSSLVMIDNRVGRNILGQAAAQVLVFGGTVGGNIRIEGGGGGGGQGATVNNVTVKGNILVRGQTTGIVYVARNNLLAGGVRVANNVTSISLEVSGNTVTEALVEVLNNTGPSLKFVQFNVSELIINCRGNTQPFLGGPNVAPIVAGQCF